MSFASLGVGTLINICSYRYLKSNEPSTAALIFYWQFCLLMQIPEGTVWVQLGQGASIEIMSHVAMVLNVCQPVALLASIWFGQNVRTLHAPTAVFMYLLLLATQFNRVWEQSRDISPERDCPHLILGYWDVSTAAIYMCSSLVCFLSIPNKFWALVNGLIFFCTLGIGAIAYPCAVASMWCWMIAGAGIILVLCELVKKKLENGKEPLEHELPPRV